MEESNTEEEVQPQIDTPGNGTELENPTPPPTDATIVEETPPTDASVNVKEGIEMEMLNEAFDNYMRIANALMKTLKRPKDREIASDLLKRIESLNGRQQLEIKLNKNRFFRFLLRVLKYTSENQPQDLYQKLFNNNEENEDKSREKPTETSFWLSEKHMYMALKILKDETVVVYVAVANDVKDGWQDGGLAILDKKAVCGRL